MSVIDGAVCDDEVLEDMASAEEGSGVFVKDEAREIDEFGQIDKDLRKRLARVYDSLAKKQGVESVVGIEPGEIIGKLLDQVVGVLNAPFSAENVRRADELLRDLEDKINKE